jgi:hypothetical protein
MKENTKMFVPLDKAKPVTENIGKKVKFSPLQALEALRVLRG